MTRYDLLRVFSFFSAAVTYGLAVANLVISFQVLRPRPFTWRTFSGSGGGFIWLHIVCVVIPFQGMITWGAVEVATRIGDPPTWRSWALLIFSMIIAVGYAIIYRVEMSRLRLRQAVSETL